MGLWEGRIDIKLGKKSCAGYFSSGRHFKCPDYADVGLASTCTACKQRDDWFGCIQCSGETSQIAAAATPEVGSYDTNSLGDRNQMAGDGRAAPVIMCKNPKQRDGCMRNNYWLYLAAFDGQLKVGCSYERRFFERMIEQGADFGCRFCIVQDGGYARSLEQKVARLLGLPDKISGDFKQAKLFGEPNKSIESIGCALTKLADSNLLKIRPEIFDFRRFYHLENVHIRPRPVQLMPGMRLAGEAIAAKGNVVVMQTAAGTISFDARRLVGYSIEMHPACFKSTAP